MWGSEYTPFIFEFKFRSISFRIIIDSFNRKNSSIISILCLFIIGLLYDGRYRFPVVNLDDGFKKP